MKKLTTNNPVIQQFIINVTLIKPIEDIISKLEANEFRDCDIKWLNKKLCSFTKLAAETINIDFDLINLVSEDGMLNEYKTNQFLKAFRTLLGYFNSINQGA